MLEAMSGNGRQSHGLRLTVRQQGPAAPPNYGLSLVEHETQSLNDLVVTVDGIKFYLDRNSTRFVEGATIDYTKQGNEAGFMIKSPYQPPKPQGLPTHQPEGPDVDAVQKLLDDQINPGVASHGGHVSLVDIKDNVVYVQLSGGCQGCASSTATLKQGITQTIKKALPHIQDVLDVTDHASGTNPYYQPGH
jgi:Fe/S biogenesis protein NfuA